MTLGNAFECPVCRVVPPVRPVVTNCCTRLFCEDCVLAITNNNCPICRYQPFSCGSCDKPKVRALRGQSEVADPSHLCRCLVRLALDISADFEVTESENEDHEVGRHLAPIGHRRNRSVCDFAFQMLKFATLGILVGLSCLAVANMTVWHEVSVEEASSVELLQQLGKRFISFSI